MYGTRGSLATAFAKLIAEMYLGSTQSITPWDVKRIVAYKAT